MAKDDYIKADDYIIDFIKETEREFNIPVEIRFKYIVNKKQKQLVKFVKIPDIYANESILNADIMVIVNDEYFDSFDDVNKRVLVEKEFDKVDFNFEKGTLKLSNPKIHVNNGFVEKHTWPRVSNAIKLEEEFEEQRKDKKNEQG